MPRVVIDPALPDRASLDNEIARMRGLDVGQLRARWQTVFRRKAPPKKIWVQLREIPVMRQNTGNFTDFGVSQMLPARIQFTFSMASRRFPVLLRTGI